MRCPACELEPPLGSRFCNRCGAALEPAADAQSEGDAERRHLTVMFCDLADSTTLSGRIDPEEMREVLHAYQEACADAIRSFDGRVAQYLGDGLLVYFGYPHAHEDDAIRAVNAALRIQQSIPELQSRLGRGIPALRENPLGVRITIHTGPVVVGDVGQGARRQRLAVGHALHLASRLQSVANPGSIALSEATLRLVRGAFAVQEMGEHALRGLDEPVRVFRVVGGPSTRSRLELAEEVGLTAFVGREGELAELVRVCQETRAARGRVVLIEGEPGIGKSRLVHRLHEELGGRSEWLTCRGSAYRANSAFQPVIELLESSFELGMELSDEEKLERLAAGLARLKLDVEATLPLFADLLSLRGSGGGGTETLGADLRRRRTLESLAAWILGQAERQPLVLVAEDLHWFDPSTLELLDLLVGRLQKSRLALLLTFRPSFDAPWRGQPHVSRIELGALSEDQVRAMVGELSQGRLASLPVLQELIRKTDGVPLFVEELTRDLVESALPSGSGQDSEAALQDLAVPETLKDSLMARLDRMESAKEVAQFASVLGREFSFELLSAALSGDRSELASALARLVVAGLLRQSGSPPEASYAFRHALIRDTAYQSLLRRTRQRYHGQVARALESRFPMVAAAQPELLALHLEEAGRVEQAIAYYERAGERATERCAHQEAIRHLSRGIALSGKLSEGPERSRREATLQVDLGVPLQATRGYADAEVRGAYERARLLARETGEEPVLFRALWGLSQHYNSRAELKLAGELNEQLLALAESRGERALRVLAHAQSGVGFFWRGESRAALEHAQRALELYQPEADGDLGYRHGQDPAVAAHAYSACALAISGRPRDAQRRAEDCLQQAICSGNPFDRAFALALVAMTCQVLGQRPQVWRHADECLSLSLEHGFPLYVGMARALRAWAVAKGDRGPDAVGELRLGLSEAAQTGNQAGAPYGMGLLAEAYLEVGEGDRGIDTVRRAVLLARRSGTHVWDAELYRLQGELLLRRQPPDLKEAERCFRTALSTSRERGMGTFELRSSLCLARLALEQGDGAGAREWLTSLDAELDVGGEFPDWLEAQALLRAL